MISNSKILICYNSPISIFSDYSGKHISNTEENDLSETGFSKEIGKLKNYLSDYFSDVKTFAVNGDLHRTVKKLQTYSPDVIFNFVESIEGIASYEYCIAALFELLDFEFTGNVSTCLGNCLNKSITKKILSSAGINTPKFTELKHEEKISRKEFPLNFPVILKLLKEDASIGISEFSVVKNFKQLERHSEFLFNTYKQDILAEEYIEGRELNAAVLGGEPLPISEIKFEGLPKTLPKIVTYESKWIAGTTYYLNTKPQCPADLSEKVKRIIEETALAAYKALECRDYARVDIRLSKENIPYVIEVNPNPDISKDSGFARAAAAKKIKYPELLLKIANLALARRNYDTQVKAG